MIESKKFFVRLSFFSTVFVVLVFLSISNAMASITGSLRLTDSVGNVAPIYQSGDKVYIKVTDTDANADTTAVNVLTVKITSETEDRIHASATIPVKPCSTKSKSIDVFLK